jgi:hypothetical protein
MGWKCCSPGEAAVEGVVVAASEADWFGEKEGWEDEEGESGSGED